LILKTRRRWRIFQRAVPFALAFGKLLLAFIVFASVDKYSSCSELANRKKAISTLTLGEKSAIELKYPVRLHWVEIALFVESTYYMVCEGSAEQRK
jgi:hypothetical protein